MIEFSKKNIRIWSLLGPSGAFGAAALELAKKNDKVLMLTSDLCYFSGLERYKMAYPVSSVNTTTATYTTGRSSEGNAGTNVGTDSNIERVFTVSYNQIC